MITEFKKIKKELLKSSQFREEYEKLSSEYQIARMLILARKEAGMTQQEVAERMRTSQSAIARIESGKPVNLRSIERYANATGNRVKIDLVRVASSGSRKTDLDQTGMTRDQE